MILILGLLIASSGCGGGETTTTEGTPAPGDTTATTTAGAGTAGGTLKVGIATASQLDPHFSASISDIMLNHQIYDFLVFIDENNVAVPDLATKWESSPDGKEWTFEIREGVKFHNGAAMTAEDVKYSFDRLRDPAVGAPTSKDIYKDISDVTVVDPTHVKFTLNNPNPAFAVYVGDYHAAILSKDVADPKTEQVGTGAFMLESFSAEDRAVLVKNPDYWMKDANGRHLPYVDGVEFIFSPDQTGQVSALRSGELNFVPGLSAELAKQLESDANAQLITNVSNMHWVLHMRADQPPANNPKFVQALKLGTDHQAIIDAVRPGLAEVGNNTPVGPGFTEYHLAQPPVTDGAKAKQLLTEAGVPAGTKITLTAQDLGDVRAIATVWKEQMKQIGIEVEIQQVPSDVYYGEGDQSWLKVPFGITDWGTRGVPVQYFEQAYVTGAAYNESHWSDAEFDALTMQIAGELDQAKRVELYKQAQQIMIERGPFIIPYMEKPVAGASADVDGIVLASDWARTLLRTATFTK